MAQLAQQPQEVFEKFYYEVCTINYPKMSKAMDPLVELMDKTDRVHLKGPGATDDDLVWARRLFDAGGETIVLGGESLMDAVTAVSGSGPAYFFYLIECMVRAGVAEGLDDADALKLATRTALGAAQLLAESGESPEALRRKVTSPGGTTQAACDLLDARGVREAMTDAVRAAAARSRQLGG
jgi:pyrroline-5-carboxylate reductase